MVRRRYELQLRRAEKEFDADGANPSAVAGGKEATVASTTADEDDDAAVVRSAMEAQRRQLLEMRSEGTIGDAAFQRIEEELDWTELGWAQVIPATS